MKMLKFGKQVRQ